MKKRPVVQTIVFSLLSLLLAGCASGDGGQIVSGVLHGVGQGLSGIQGFCKVWVSDAPIEAAQGRMESVDIWSAEWQPMTDENKSGCGSPRSRSWCS